MLLDQDSFYCQSKALTTILDLSASFERTESTAAALLKNDILQKIVELSQKENNIAENQSRSKVRELSIGIILNILGNTSNKEMLRYLVLKCGVASLLQEYITFSPHMWTKNGVIIALNNLVQHYNKNKDEVIFNALIKSNFDVNQFVDILNEIDPKNREVLYGILKQIHIWKSIKEIYDNIDQVCELA